MKSHRGQILPLALVMILVMTLFWVMLINIGMLLKNRVQLQIAADTSVQSACAIRARALSSIGRMNSWLGTPVLGIGSPLASWWPDAASLQQDFVKMVRTLQAGYNSAYGGGWAAQLVRNNIAIPQGADAIYSPLGSYSLHLQINHGPVWYLSTRHVVIYGVPVPVPFLPQILEEDPSNRRWYERASGFNRTAMRLYVYRRAASPLFHIQMPDLYAVASARVYNTGGPMFPIANSSDALLTGLPAQSEYDRAAEHWQAQLVPVGGPYEH